MMLGPWMIGAGVAVAAMAISGEASESRRGVPEGVAGAGEGVG